MYFRGSRFSQFCLYSSPLLITNFEVSFILMGKLVAANDRKLHFEKSCNILCFLLPREACHLISLSCVMCLTVAVDVLKHC